MRISEVVAGKASQDIVTIKPEATVRELVTLLAQHNIGAAVVSSDGVTVSGIVSERDVVRQLNSNDQALSASVADIMTTNVRTCESSSESSSSSTAARMRRLRARWQEAGSPSWRYSP